MDLGSHSMLHQTLISTSIALFPSSSCSSALPSHITSVREKEMTIEAFKSCMRPDYSGAFSVPAAAAVADDWVLEGGAVPGGDGVFSLEDLVDMGEFAEPEKDSETEADAALGTGAAVDSDKSDVSFEPPPPVLVIDLPEHVAKELEWVSQIIDESQAEPAAAAAAPWAGAASDGVKSGSEGKHPTICAMTTDSMVPLKKAKRSKRAHGAGAGVPAGTASWSLSGGGKRPFADSNSSSSATTSSSCSSSASFSPLLLEHPFGTGCMVSLDDAQPPAAKKHKPKKRGRKPKQLHVAAQEAFAAAYPSGGVDRRCSHCGATKTPQWRAGPQGSKTLCNACGVRFKSGRLVPEYRPACSPTFVSTVHSNSHRKILEMRRQKEGGVLSTAAPPVHSF